MKLSKTAKVLSLDPQGSISAALLRPVFGTPRRGGGRVHFPEPAVEK